MAEKCTNCGGTKFKDGFFAGERGILSYTEGKPNLKNQLFGKKKKLKLRICKGCGNTLIFAK